MQKNLTTWEAACIITGYGIGGGVLSMPYLAQRIGFINAVIVLAVAFAASYVLHLMIADLSLKTQGGGQIIACLEQFLFRGKMKKLLTVGFFGLLIAILFTNLTGYITGAEEILVGLFPSLSSLFAKLIFYLIAASVVLLGLKAVGVSEKVSIAVMSGLIALLAVFSFFGKTYPVPLLERNFSGCLAYYGMAMFSLAAFFSVPQAVKGLGGDCKKIKKAVFLGFLNNFVIIVVINFCAILKSEQVTQVAMTGWTAGIGLWAQLVGGLFTVVAMLTTYWSLSLALSDIVAETTRMNSRLAWLVATAPSLVLALVNPGGFMSLMRTAGGLISIIIAVMVVPAYMNCRKIGQTSVLKRNSATVCGIFILAYILMGVGSVVPY